MQSISEFNPPLQRGPFRIAYRYRPNAIGDASTLDNGAIVTDEFRLRSSRAKRLADLIADPRIQWAREVE